MAVIVWFVSSVRENGGCNNVELELEPNNKKYWREWNLDRVDVLKLDFAPLLRKKFKCDVF